MKRRKEPEVGTIEAVTHDGRGIAAVSGKKVFVAGALPGEQVRFLRRKKRRNYDEAELLEVLEPAAERITPKCAAYGVCGGCSFQHVSGEEQRAIKTRALKDNLQRIGQVEPASWLPAVYAAGDQGEWQYRRRARLAVKDVAAKGRVLVGFRERHAPYVTDMHRCEVLAAGTGGLIDPLSELIAGLSIRSRLPQIELAAGDDVTTLVFRVLDPPSDADRLALSQFGRQHNLQIVLQPGGPDSLESLFPETPVTLSYALPEFDLDIEFAATDFVQVNSRVNELLIATAIDLLQLSGQQRVLDLYCGIGNFSLPLARRAAHVLGLEGESAQVSRARENARHNGLQNVEFLTADLSQVDGSESWLRQNWDRVLLDPARSGAQEIVIRLAAVAASRIVYVSCHPGTLARDAGLLVREAGYRLEAAGIVDMFPHTGHVESMAVFSKEQ